ncbi:ribosome quality control complex subunit TCF25-like isoform X2 [Choristoneura fumiferana]
MSTRNLRKAYGGNNTLPAPDDSEDDYEPYNKNKVSAFTYAGLELSSGSEEHNTSEADSVEEEEPEPQPETTKKKNKKKKKKQKKAKPITNDDEEDEIDKSIKEINALMGSPVPAVASTSEENQKHTLIPEILVVQQKHLNVANELKKKFGTDSAEDRSKRGNRQAQLRIQKKSLIVPQIENLAAFPKVGLSMSVARRAGGCVYFTFDHDAQYRRRQQRLLARAAAGRAPDVAPEEAQRHMHVESMLESADMMFRIEEYTVANTLIEQSIAYMQFVAHPSFQLTDPSTRLEYSYMENRTFHILILKYLHLLTNRACHRTALELAKMLLNLDPTDPLAILFIIDTLALRAREHQWLIDAVDHWSKERNAGFLFNIQFSYAMAHYHVAVKHGGDTSKADDLLQNAMLRFPTILMKLYECANVTPSAKLQAHTLFNSATERMTRNLNDLIFLYAKFTWSKWREPAVFEWLKQNAEALADRYDADPALQERAKVLVNEGLNLFRSWPDEVIRHLCVIKPMSSLLVDGAVPEVTNLVASDPSPPNQGVNRYGYTFGPQGDSRTAAQSTLRELFSSLLPNYAVYAPPDLE